MGTRLQLVVLIIVTGLCVPSLAQRTKPAAVEYPRYFAPDDQNKGFRHGEPPTDLLLDALLATSEAKESESELNGMNREELRALFQVVAVHLGPTDEQDYIALGSGPLTGADCFWFWIVRVRGGRAQVLLFLNGLSVSILSSQTDGYSDIRGDWGTAAFSGMGIFKYDGRVYRRVRSRSWENKP